MTFHFRNLIPVSLLLASCILTDTADSMAAVVDEALITEKVSAHVKEKLATLVSKDDQQYVTVDVLRVPNAPYDFPQTASLKAIDISLESNLGTMYSERIQKPVWGAKHPIQARQPLNASDFKLQMRDVSHTYSYAVGAERQLGEYISRVNINAGDALDSRKIVIPPDVICNDQVRILISNGNGMVVAVPGIAMANGRIGETIRVRQDVYQRKYYSAKVIDKNQVLVEI